MKTILNSQTFELSDTSSTFLIKYLERMKYFIENNNIEIEVYEDIEERVAEIFSAEQSEKISDKVVINIINEIGEPDEIFSELIVENNESTQQQKSNETFKDYFSKKGKQLNRNSKKGIFFGVSYGIAERYNIDPLWVRLIFIFGIFLGGSTLLLYIVLIFLLPNSLDKKKDDSILVHQSQKIGQKLDDIKKQDRKDLNIFKIKTMSKVRELGNKMKTHKIIAHFSSSKIKKIDDKVITIVKNDKKLINEVKKEKKSQINNYSLASSENERKEKIVYREVRPNIIIRLFRFIISIIKNIFYFTYHAGRFLLAFIIFISAIPTLIAVLFASGFIFSNIDINNQLLFEQVDFFLKIGIVGLLFSLFFAIFGIFLKILSSKVVANTFMISGLIGILIFTFVTGLGFFKTANQFTNIYTHTQILEYETKNLHIQDLEIFTNPKGINWISNIQLIQTNDENITIEVTSAINRKTQKIADNIFEKLSPISVKKNNQFDLAIYKDVSFTEIVDYGFLRKEIKIYLPQDAFITFGSIDGNNINNISNIYFPYKGGDYEEIWYLKQCENTTLVYDSELKGYKCLSEFQIGEKMNSDVLPEEDIINQIDDMISEEINNIEV